LGYGRFFWQKGTTSPRSQRHFQLEAAMDVFETTPFRAIHFEQDGEMIGLEDQMRPLLLGSILYMAGMLVKVAINRHSKTTDHLPLGLRYLPIGWLVYKFEVLDVNRPFLRRRHD
jgi:hypothetical protein